MDDGARTEFEELFGTADRIVVDPRALERKFTIPERNRAIVREFREVIEASRAGTVSAASRAAARPSSSR